MRILFVIQGEGRGHLTQALSLSQKLADEGHQVVGALIGKSKVRHIPDFFVEKMGAPVYPFESPNFLPAAKGKRPKLLQSIGFNILRLPTYTGSMKYIARMIEETEAELVINFYELLTGLAYLLLRPKTPLVCIAHQYLFLHPDFAFPKLPPFSLSLLKLFTRMTAIGATKKLALSFREMREVPARRLVVVPPLLRREVLDEVPRKGDYLHGYLLNNGFSDEVTEWHAAHPEVPLHFFWDKKEAGETTRIDDTLSFHRLNDSLFIRYMAHAKAYATTAGFESVCEAMYLEKPVLMVPTHIEQACNAHDASLSKAGVVAGRFNLDALLRLSENYRPDPMFRRWVQSADRLILRELRGDSLFQQHATATSPLLPGQSAASSAASLQGAFPGRACGG